jgi:DNA-binding NarL/FixJ family response regulator
MTAFLIVDDHPLFREAIQIAVRAVAPNADIHEATELAAAIDMIAERRLGYDLALVDLTLPDTTGFDGIALLRRKFPSLPVLVISAHDDAAIVRDALALGAAGFVSKSSPKNEIAKAISTVLAGGTWPTAPSRAASVRAPGAGDDVASRLSSLTPQQLRVLQMLRQGKLNKQIAHELDVGETTVKAHVSEILRKLGVFSRTQAVIEASRIDPAQLNEATSAPTLRR